MDEGDFELKAGASLYGRKLLNVHLDAVATDGNVRAFLFGSYWFCEACALDNALDGTPVGEGKPRLKFMGNGNGAVVGVCLTMVENGLAVFFRDDSGVVEWCGGQVKRRVAVDPPLNGRRIDPETGGELADAYSFLVEPFDFLTLFYRECCLGVYFHCRYLQAEATVC